MTYRLQLERFDRKEGRDPTPNDLPCRFLIVGDVLGRATPAPWSQRAPRVIGAKGTLTDLSGLRPRVEFSVASGEEEDEPRLAVSLEFNSIQDFEPAAVAGRIPTVRKLAVLRRSLRVARQQLEQKRPLDGAIERLLASVLEDGPSPDSVLRNFAASLRRCREVAEVDALIARVGSEIGRIVEAVVNHAEFRALEAQWRSIELLVRAAADAPADAPVQIDVLDASRDDLEDMIDGSINYCRLYRILYHEAYGTYGGRPYTAVVTLYEFTGRPEDVAFLRALGDIGRLVQAPVLVNASPELFGLSEFARLTTISDMEERFASPIHQAWRLLRESESSRFLAMCVPRVLVRLPHRSDLLAVTLAQAETGADNEPATERVPFRPSDMKNCLWGCASVALAAVMGRSFAQFRWCFHIVGLEGGGLVPGVPELRREDLAHASRYCTDAFFTDSLERQLAKCGFVPLVHRRDQGRPCFFSAPSVRRTAELKLKEDGEFDAASVNDWVNGQLQYLLVAARVAHYLKAVPREWIGEGLSGRQLSERLTQWLRKFQTEGPTPRPEIRAEKPLRKFELKVEATQVPGFFQSSLVLEPHLPALGAEFSLRVDLHLGMGPGT